MDIILFGDQTADFYAFLSKAVLRKGDPQLTSFLDQAYLAIRDEVSQLSSEERKKIPNFSSIAELVERYYTDGTPYAPLEGALVCLAQFVHFIGYFEENPYSYLERKSSTRIIGICTGLLTAQAVASCRSLAALIPLAVQTLRISFRIGAHASATALQLEVDTCGDGCWSYIVLDIGEVEAENALNAFNTERGLKHSKRLYISSIGIMSVTISGPPSLIQQLFDSSEAFKSLRRRQIPIYAPYHAPHLYNDADVDAIIPAESASIMQRSHRIFPLVVPEGMTYDNGATLLDAIRSTVLEILTNRVYWDKAVRCLSDDLHKIAPSTCRVLAFGPTTLGTGLVSSLKSSGLILSLEDHVSWLANNSVPAPHRVPMSNSKIAIVGMAGRFPDAADHEALWKLLESGLDVHRKVPADRFDADKYCDPSGKGKNLSHTPFGCFITDPGLFDPRFFNMSPREAAQTDPMQRLALTTAYEAMEMAGFVINRTPSSKAHRVATFYGQTSDDWREINAAQDIDTYFITGGVRAFGPGRINYHFNFSGPSFSVDTACSSSLAAIQLACTSLRAGECDTVFAGGMSVLTNPDIFSGLSKGQFLSKTGSCKTYDQGADGYCRGDGVATVILKRLDDAILDKDPILGVIVGSATNHSAEAVSITHPHVGAQKFLFQKVMDEAGINVREVDYVEMHGTGTQAGDGVEMESVSSVFAPSGSRALRREDQPLFLGSIKSNIGHGEAVSGVCALIKILLMLDKNMIPPHCGIKGTMNKGFPKDMRERNINIAFKPTPFPRKTDSKDRRHVFLNNFSAAGGNTALLLEDGPSPMPLQQDPRSVRIVTVSAKGLGSFQKNVKRLLDYVNKNPNVNLSSLAYTTTARRSHYNYRVALDVTSIGQLKDKLESLAEKSQAPVSSTPPKIAFAFTGQGSHYSAMGKDLYASSLSFRKVVDSAASIAMIQGFPDFRNIIDGSTEVTPETSPIMTQLAITVLEIALAREWQSYGITASAVVGHSLGEYAALHYAGVLSLFDVIFLVGHRAELLVAGCTPGSHGMLAVRGSAQHLDSFLSSMAVEVACINSPQDTVLAGLVEHIKEAETLLLAEGFKCTMLNVPFAFHSSQVDPILADIEKLADSVTFHKPAIPVISPLLATVVNEFGQVNPNYISRHCRDAVDFVGGIDAALQQGLISEDTRWVEIGPGPICSGLVKSIIGSGCVTNPSLRKNEENWTTVSKSLVSLYESGIAVDWNEFHRGFESCQNMLRLPSYGFDEKVYWIQYKNDWTISKGEHTAAVADTTPKQVSTTIHKIASTLITSETITVTSESDLADPLLRAAVCGHLVNGAGLCPSSLYADMALTICKHAYKAAYPELKDEPSMNVQKMETHKPLLVDIHSAPQSQLLQVEAKLNLATRSADLVYRSVNAEGKPTMEHARCVVTFEDQQLWKEDWARKEYLVKSRIEKLKASKTSNVIHRGMAYKLFSALVDYDDKYRGMESVILDSGELEALSQVSFQASSKDGQFLLNPYFIDSVCHLTGFIMNANDAVNSKDQVYISHGWGGMRFAEGLVEDKRYQAYVKMQPIPGAGKAVAGDVYVFENDRIVGVAEAVKFQAIPRQLLLTLLKAPSAGAKSVATAAKPQQAATPTKSPRASISQTAPVTKSRKPSLPKTMSMTAAVQSTPSGLCEKALQVIAIEIGCARNELADPIVFSDIGVDSLMSLTILGRFREEFELDIPSTLFADLTTVGQLKGYLNGLNAADIIGLAPMSHSTSSCPSIDLSDTSSLASDSFEQHEADALMETPGNDFHCDDKDLANILRCTIAAEMGVDIQEITGTTDLSTMGMDSLMSLTILGALREKTGMEIQSDLLTKSTSVSEIEASLGLHTPPVAMSARKLSADIVTPIVPLEKANKLLAKHTNVPTVDISIYPRAKSILLQGSIKTATRNLFLLPDGSGSATSYVPIPDIDPTNLCLYGLNCPFMTTPEAWNIGVPAVVQIYLAEIRRRQPEGPYLLSGWSAGGVLALELTRQLVLAGEEVEHVIFLDSPCPINLEALPPSFHQFCDKIGLLGDGKGKTPDWLLPHFASTVIELTKFSEALDPKTWPKSKMPNATLVWARNGLCPTADSPRPEWDDSKRLPNAMQWLCDNRDGDLLGTNGWEKLFPRGRLRCVSTEGDHFTMMREPHIQDVGRLIREALEE